MARRQREPPPPSLIAVAGQVMAGWDTATEIRRREAAAGRKAAVIIGVTGASRDEEARRTHARKRARTQPHPYARARERTHTHTHTRTHAHTRARAHTHTQVERCLSSGMNDVISKPFDRPVLSRKARGGGGAERGLLLAVPCRGGDSLMLSSRHRGSLV